MAKCLLLAVFAYQLTYIGWVRLEQDEVRTERECKWESIRGLRRDEFPAGMVLTK